LSRFLAGLSGSGAETDPCSPNVRLRGRTYAIPFEQVWRAALGLVNAELHRWRLMAADDEKGVIEAVAMTWPRDREDKVEIRVSLDANAQTRVDVSARPRDAKPDLGRNARRIGSFLKKLDKRLNAVSTQILDASQTPTRTS